MINHQYKRGFTIIEVVLVLAIAGLIFAMVFVALPALNRGQRDTARKNDVSTVASAVNTYRSAQRTLDGITSAKLQGYIDKLNQYDKSGVQVATSDTINPGMDKIMVRIKKKCPDTIPAPGTESITLVNGTPRGAAVVALLENNGSKKQIICQDV